MSRNRAIIYEEAGADPAVDRIVTERGEARTTIVAVPEAAAAIPVAAELVEDGIDRIELCGGMGPVWQARVIESAEGRVPVGAIRYGFESLTGVAAYKAQFEAGASMAAAFIYLQAEADPAVDRVVKKAETGRTTFVGVPDADAAAKVALELADEGVQLIELYGDFTTTGAAQLVDAVEGQAPVGLVSFGTESLAGADARETRSLRARG